MPKTTRTLAVCALTLACNVDPAPLSTGGIERPETTTNCPSALVVTMSDYQSTNIALSSPDGETLSGSFVSTGATPANLSFALSGDVALPSEPAESGQVVLIDRFGTNVITWLDPASAAVRAQLSIGTGFEANAQDYLEISKDTALVSRFGKNPAPGALPFDAGGDLLVLDTKTPAIVGTIPLPEEDPELSPSPGAMTRLGEQVIVGLNRMSADFSRMGNARFVAISGKTLEIGWTLELADLKGCGKLMLAPSAKLAAAACSGQYDAKTFEYPAAGSDVVLIDVSEQPAREIRRLRLGEALGVALQPHLEFVSEKLLLVTTFGGTAVPGDQLVAVDLATNTNKQLAVATKSYVFEGLRCTPGCSNRCLLADAERAILHRFQIGPDLSLSELESVTVESTIGLPPRQIGALK